ncbi:uncharacterized protein EDB93DRAFT_1278755 [Suillus bovinus]|uniref:uncharacterized protein n=1 Tax=Suillus bovinus TaxID=48563 RepID=UPI001B866FF7|nr:uncharacterized protein EDB93DRAFT_1278755 [Suillus bovinus]KAG2125997.1 hypothetical protein EDB93DRAFT_1278755 [Suillus bovinus]
MDPPKSSTTFRITTPLGPAGQFANSPMTVIELKGRTNHEKGEHYLQLSLSALRELADLLENDRLSPTEKAIYNRAYTTGQRQYDEVKRIRDQLLTQKKTFRKFLINLFVRTDARRFYKVSYETYSSIRRTSEDLTRRLLPDKSVISVSESPGEKPSEGHVSVCEENPREVAEVFQVGAIILSLRPLITCSGSVADLPPDETIKGITVEVHNKEEEQEVFANLKRITNCRKADENEEEEEDDDRTIKPTPSQSRPPSPSPSCTVIWNNYYINQSVASFDSELRGTTLNIGVDGGGSLSGRFTDTDQPPSQ